MTFGALNQDIIGSHTESEWQQLLRDSGWRCYLCGNHVYTRDMASRSGDGRDASERLHGRVPPEHEATKDHLCPTSRGGVNFIWNIRPACLRCNRLKGNKTLEEFIATRPLWFGLPQAVDVAAGNSTGISLLEEGEQIKDEAASWAWRNPA